MTAARDRATVAPAPEEAVDLHVRAATPRDLDAVLALRLALLREHPDHPIYGRLRPDVTARARQLFGAQLRSPSEAIFLADRSGDAIGVLRCVESVGSPLFEPARYAYVSSVYVRPDARRRGALRAMLVAAEQWARERGLDQMRLHNVAGSTPAEAAWSALGFAVVEQVRLRAISLASG
ncbi:MAG TPA: GNAT family N-acetyltransferase [Gemmatimonadaceae bacterium]|nr:GNAT family N-acetyltransferase [Gemmatimonadaceae bacterium]